MIPCVHPAPLPAAGSPGTDAAPRRDPPMPVLRSDDLLQGQRAVEILHAGVRYRLSVTALGKLILTK